jgi:exopolysaccharide biosynthesis WecB/TagA/CpsF family protein
MPDKNSTQKTIGGIAIENIKRNQALEAVLQRLSNRIYTQIAFANANLIVQAGQEKKLAGLKRFMVFNDGIALDLGAYWATGSKFCDNNNGTDFTPELLQRLPEGTRVFLLGARQDVVAKAAEYIEQTFPCTVCGFQDGFHTDWHKVARKIFESEADLVLVAMGNPRQELFIDQFGPQTGATVLMGIGALFDFMTGTVKRAPDWVQAIRCEWLFRLAQEPRRLIKRYTLDMLKFARMLSRKKTALPSK